MDAPQGTNAITLDVLGTFETGIFDEGAAEIVAFDAETDRLFVINADANTIDILDIADPTVPTLIDNIDLSAAFAGAGSVNSISVSNGIVAAAVANDDDTLPGSIVFLDTDGAILNTVEVGVLPDNVAFSADGSFVVVANEGEPVDVNDDEVFDDADVDVDPEGSISVIDLAGGVAAATVATADFTAFNGSEADLVGDGVRIFPGRTVAQDVEPEFVAIAPDGTQAFVSLQENNAIALVDLSDLASPTVADILPLGVTDFSQGLPTLDGLFDVPLETAEFQIGTDPDTGAPIFLGGLSGLAFDGINPETGNPQFLAINDRGPVEGTIDTDDPDSSDRPFLTPDLQVTVVTLELDEAAGSVSVVDSFGLTQSDGTTPITGLTNIPGFFEVPIDAATGEILENDPFGLDSEGIIRDPNTNNLYVVEETAPSISVFSPEGVLIDRFVPIGYADQGDGQAPGLDFNPGDFGSETLPEVYLERRNNRGFEGVAFDDEQGILYAFVQTPFSNPDIDTSNASSVLRVLGVDPATGTPLEEFVYFLQTPAAVTTGDLEEVGFGSAEIDRIGDAVFAGDGQFFVIERDNEDIDTAQQFVFDVNFTGSSDILGSEFLSSSLSGDQEVITLEDGTFMPVDTGSEVTAEAVLQLNPAGDALAYSITFSEGLDFSLAIESAAGDQALSPGAVQGPDDPDNAVTGLHFHNGVAGTNGPVEFGIIGPFHDDDDLSIVTNGDGTTTVSGVWEDTDPEGADVSAFLDVLQGAEVGSDVGLYFNLHTFGNPPGEIRGQLVGATLEQFSPDDFADVGLQPANKLQVTNLPSLGFSPTPQTEGLALIPADEDNGLRLAVTNDNDYEGPDSPTQLGILGFDTLSNGLDPSDEDGGINIANQPVFGFFQPDTIASFEIDGETFFITANEGDTRDDLENLTDVDRIADLTLDETAFGSGSIETQFNVDEGFTTGALDPVTLSNGDFSVTFSGGQQQQGFLPAAYNVSPAGYVFNNGEFNGLPSNSDMGLIDFTGPGAETVSFFAANLGNGPGTTLTVFGLDDTTVLGTVTVSQDNIQGDVNPEQTVLSAAELGGAIGSIGVDLPGPAANPPYAASIDTFAATPVDLQADENLGRLEASTIDGDLDGDGDFDQLFAFGSRSFSIRDALGNLVFDSGDDFEQITADLIPADFNSDNDENDSFDSRSDDAGPEPEGLAIGEVDGILYAFIGLERPGGIAVYDISDPANSEFVQYVNNRDFTVEAQLPDESTNPAVGDLGPEGLAFISAEDSPTGEPLLAVGNEVSGTTTIFGITIGDILADLDVDGDGELVPAVDVLNIFRVLAGAPQAVVVPEGVDVDQQGIVDAIEAFADLALDVDSDGIVTPAIDVLNIFRVLAGAPQAVAIADGLDIDQQGIVDAVNVFTA